MSAPLDVEVVWGTELPARDLDRMLRIEAQAGKPVEQDAPRGARLVAREPRADAQVRAGREGQVRALPPVDVVALGLAPVALVVVGGSEYRSNERALFELDAAELRITGRLPRRGADRGVPACRLLDRRVDELRVGTHLLQLLWMGQDRPHRQRDQVGRGLQPPDDHHLEVRLDLLPRQPLSLD